VDIRDTADGEQEDCGAEQVGGGNPVQHDRAHGKVFPDGRQRDIHGRHHECNEERRQRQDDLHQMFVERGVHALSAYLFSLCKNFLSANSSRIMLHGQQVRE